MLNKTYPFALPPLPYAYDALEPYIDAETLRYHHDKHFAAYVNNLNAALEKHECLQNLTLKRLLTAKDLPADVETAVKNNAGGVFNHDFYFKRLSPNPQPPSPELSAEMARLGDVKAQLNTAALNVFGSGYGALIRHCGKLRVIQLKNQETPFCVYGENVEPIAMLDVWEHAYYLKYKNARADYLNGIWNVLVFQGNNSR